MGVTWRLLSTTFRTSFVVGFQRFNHVFHIFYTINSTHTVHSNKFNILDQNVQIESIGGQGEA